LDTRPATKDIRRRDCPSAIEPRLDAAASLGDPWVGGTDRILHDLRAKGLRRGV